LSAAATTDANQVYIGLGSNIEPEHNLRAAVEALRQRVQVTALSSAWRSAPVGSPGPDFLNAAAELRTALDAAALKAEVLRPIEEMLGRVRTADPDAPRTIDLDILVFNQQVMDPTIWLHAHLALPLAEVSLHLAEPQSQRRLIEVAEQLGQQTDIHVQPDVLP
jgi:2-amino-4-hydroxy-6-hydroxymethyldihydropteridine diphosphokinase